MVRWLRIVGVFGLFLGLAVTALPVRGADWYFASGTSTPYPAQYSDAVIVVHLAWDYAGTQPISDIAVHTVWNYRTTTSYSDGYTGGDGYARLSRNISGATCGYTVRVDIFVSTSQRQIDSAYFTPCGGGAASYSPSYQAPPPYQPPPDVAAPLPTRDPVIGTHEDYGP